MVSTTMRMVETAPRALRVARPFEGSRFAEINKAEKRISANYDYALAA